jgi:hypothetical protein
MMSLSISMLRLIGWREMAMGKFYDKIPAGVWKYVK